MPEDGHRAGLAHGANDALGLRFAVKAKAAWTLATTKSNVASTSSGESSEPSARLAELMPNLLMSPKEHYFFLSPGIVSVSA
jgi:hypothetical protein